MGNSVGVMEKGDVFDPTKAMETFFFDLSRSVAIKVNRPVAEVLTEVVRSATSTLWKVGS